MGLFNNIPCRDCSHSDISNRRMPATITVDGMGAHAPVIVPGANDNLPCCSQITIVDELTQFIKDNPLLAGGIAIAIYFMFFKK